MKCMPGRSQFMFVCYDCMNDCMKVCFLVYISISIPVCTAIVQAQKNASCQTKDFENSVWILHVRVVHLYIPLPSFLQIQSNNSLGSYFFPFLCCIEFSPLLFYYLVTSNKKITGHLTSKVCPVENVNSNVHNISMHSEQNFNCNFNCSIVWWVWLVTCQTMIE